MKEICIILYKVLYEFLSVDISTINIYCSGILLHCVSFHVEVLYLYRIWVPEEVEKNFLLGNIFYTLFLLFISDLSSSYSLIRCFAFYHLFSLSIARYNPKIFFEKVGTCFFKISTHIKICFPSSAGVSSCISLKIKKRHTVHKVIP